MRTSTRTKPGRCMWPNIRHCSCTRPKGDVTRLRRWRGTLPGSVSWTLTSGQRRPAEALFRPENPRDPWLSRIHAVETNPHPDPLPFTKGEGDVRWHRVRVTEQPPKTTRGRATKRCG